MELREFAEQVLFATTLEEKLSSPEKITDLRPGSPLVAPATPGRPRELRFKTSGEAREFPGLHQLEREEERGRLLHFFANHELLATELMALVLLRFPEAPAAFRRGVLQTLRDEQEHTRLYLRRMEECGIQFGALPVSGYFWRAVSGMENPIDYVAGLSLTFEQANLDFARQFARGFAAVGDAATADLLEGIYRDEIAHVAYGLKWFRRWKDPRVSDWEAFCRQLKFPLSPQRAKGAVLNVEGRRAAGLDAQFIAELSVYSQSRGRTPSVFVFNPLAEGFVAQGRSFTPVKHQQSLALDLANLPQFLARNDDVVLGPQRPALEFLSDLQAAGFALPEFVELQEGRIPPNSSVCGRKIGTLRPWAWGPDSVELFGPLFGNVTGDTPPAEQCFNPTIARLYSKAWSAGFLRRVLADTGIAKDEPSAWLCSPHEAGVVAGTMEEALEAVRAIRARGHHRVVVKEAIGLAGHNAIRLWEPAILEPQRRWMTRALAKGQQLVVEPWLERELDFSIQLERTRQGLRVRGYTGLINDRKGQFQGNWAEPDFRKRFPARLASLLDNTRIIRQAHEFYAGVFARLEDELRRADYVGPLGIDALVYRTSKGDCRLKPIVEINPRYTMGRLTVELMQRTVPGSHGLFRLVSRTSAEVERSGGFIAYARALREQHPVVLEGEPVPRIRSGAVCLNNPAEARVCLATFQVPGRALGVR